MHQIRGDAANRSALLFQSPIPASSPAWQHVLPPSFALHRNNLAGSTAQLICSTSPTASGRVRSAGRGRAGAVTVGSTKLRRRMWASSARVGSGKLGRAQEGRSRGAGSSATGGELRVGRLRRSRPVASRREQLPPRMDPAGEPPSECCNHPSRSPSYSPVFFLLIALWLYLSLLVIER